MTTLTQITINPRSTAAQRDLSDSQALHQRVMSLLPDSLGTTGRHDTATLHRIDRTSDGTIHLLIQTSLPALDLSGLPDAYTSHPPRTLNLDAIHERLQTGIAVRYAVTANPTRNLHRPGQRGKRVPISGYPNVAAWWHNKAASIGLDIDDRPPMINPAPHPRGHKDGQRVTHRAYRIEGIAAVTDATALRRSLLDGIGPGKAYGLGLLTVLPVPDRPPVRYPAVVGIAPASTVRLARVALREVVGRSACSKSAPGGTSSAAAKPLTRLAPTSLRPRSIWLMAMRSMPTIAARSS